MADDLTPSDTPNPADEPTTRDRADAAAAPGHEGADVEAPGAGPDDADGPDPDRGEAGGDAAGTEGGASDEAGASADASYDADTVSAGDTGDAGGVVGGRRPRRLVATAVTAAATALAIAAVIVGAVWAVAAIVDDDDYGYPGHDQAVLFGPVSDFGPGYYPESTPRGWSGWGDRPDRFDRHGAERDRKRGEFSGAPDWHDHERAPHGWSRGGGWDKGKAWPRGGGWDKGEAWPRGGGWDKGGARSRGDSGDESAERHSEESCNAILSFGANEDAVTLMLCVGSGAALSGLGGAGDHGMRENGLDDLLDLDSLELLPFLLMPLLGLEDIPDSRGGEFLPEWLDDWGVGVGPRFGGGEFLPEWLEEWARPGSLGSDGGGSSRGACFGDGGRQFCFDFSTGSESGGSEES